MKNRESSIELLKIIAVVLIIISHTLPVYNKLGLECFVNLTLTTQNTNTMIMIVLRALGQVGNAIFMVCSAYFLIDIKKARISKIFKMIFDTTIISIVFFIIFVRYFGQIFDYKTLILSFFPTLYIENYWFICCYILLYALHPLLNIVIESLSKRKLLLLNLCMITLYSIINMIYEKTFFYTELVGFVEIYFIVAYIKRYMLNFQKSVYKNISIFIISIYCFMFSILFTNLLGLKYEYFNNKNLYWIIISNPFIILISVTLLNIFKSIEIKSKIFNYLASLSLLIYIISENHFVREVVRMRFFDYYSAQEDMMKLILIDFLRTTFVSLVIAILYKSTIKKITDIISDKLEKRTYYVGRKLLDTLEKID